MLKFRYTIVVIWYPFVEIWVRRKQRYVETGRPLSMLVRFHMKRELKMENEKRKRHNKWRANLSLYMYYFMAFLLMLCLTQGYTEKQMSMNEQLDYNSMHTIVLMWVWSCIVFKWVWSRPKKVLIDP